MREHDKYAIIAKLAVGLANSPRYSTLGYMTFDPKTIDPNEVEGTHYVRISHSLANEISNQLAALYGELTKDAS